MPQGHRQMVQPDQGLWVHQAERRRQGRVRPYLRRRARRTHRPSMKIRSWNMTSWKIAAKSFRGKPQGLLDFSIRVTRHDVAPGSRRGILFGRAQTELLSALATGEIRKLPDACAVRRPADIAFDLNRAGREQPQRFGIDAMLDLEDALGQRLRGVVIADGDRALHHDRPGVGLGNHEVNGRA